MNFLKLWPVAALLSSAVHAEPVSFRDILVSVLSDVAPELNPDRVVYGVPADLGEESFNPAASAQANLEAIDASFLKYNPLELFNYGTLQPSTPVSISDIDAALAAKPITLVLVPGYLSEFAGTQFAEEIFSRNSHLAGLWTAKLNLHRGQDVATDVYYSLGDNTNYRDSLGSVVSAASIDVQGAPLIRLIAFRFPEKQTLESVGTVEEVSALYRRRFGKAMQLIGDNLDNLVFVGHSRGVAVALDMIAKGKQENAAWVSKVKGVVSYGGIVNGSRSADRMDIAGSLEHQTVHANRELQSNLRSGSNLNPFVLIGNLRAYNRFKNTNEAIKKKTTDRLNSFFGNSPVHEPKYSGIDAIMDKLGEQMDQSGGGTKAHKMKIFIGKTLNGLEGLRTNDRLNWWKQNTLPVQGVRYYSLASTMTDPRRSADDQTLVAQSPTHIMDSDDFRMGLKSYRSMLLEPKTTNFDYNSAMSLNDGNVSIQRTIFWPMLIASLNPANTLDTEFLGVVGANHFALAHAKANEDSPANPLSRLAILKAIAAKAAFDIN